MALLPCSFSSCRKQMPTPFSASLSSSHTIRPCWRSDRHENGSPALSHTSSVLCFSFRSSTGDSTAAQSSLPLASFASASDASDGRSPADCCFSSSSEKYQKSAPLSAMYQTRPNWVPSTIFHPFWSLRTCPKTSRFPPGTESNADASVSKTTPILPCTSTRIRFRLYSASKRFRISPFIQSGRISGPPVSTARMAPCTNSNRRHQLVSSPSSSTATGRTEMESPARLKPKEGYSGVCACCSRQRRWCAATPRLRTLW